MEVKKENIPNNEGKSPYKSTKSLTSFTFKLNTPAYLVDGVYFSNKRKSLDKLRTLPLIIQKQFQIAQS